MLEKILQKKILNYLKAENIYAVKVVAANKAGVPDILACVDGKFVALEVKANSKLSILQANNLKAIELAGGLAAVVKSVDDVMSIVKQCRR